MERTRSAGAALVALLVLAVSLVAASVASAQATPDLVVNRAQMITPQFAGYGGQVNGRVYASISRSAGVTEQNVQEFQRKLGLLQPQFVRVFVTAADLNDQDRRASLARSLMLAQWSGATINLTWQGGTLDVASGTVPKLAEFLNQQVPKLDGLRWLTIQNEPNSTKMTYAAYEKQYRELDPYVANVRGQLRYMGGDLIQQNQALWLQYMAAHMNDILDAWSIHVYWDYWDTPKLVSRLTDVKRIYDSLAPDMRKPLYVTEFSVRGQRSANGVSVGEPGLWEDGTPLQQTDVMAFQQAWFDVLAARLGYLATLKWDLHFAKYDNGTQAHWVIGPPDQGWPALPAYNAVKLFTATMKPGWSVVAVDGAAGTKLATAFAAPGGGALTVIGLDTAGAQVSGYTPVRTSYTIGGLPPQATFSLAVWNELGNGAILTMPALQADASGAVTFTAPVNAVFALTTIPSPIG